MILVDSSIWIEFFRRRPSSIHEPMDALLREIPVEVAICGIILQEVLQGSKSEKEFQWVKTRFLMLPWLETTQQSHLSAARLSREIRYSGIALTSVDALIAAVAAQYDAALWTFDKDFIAAARFLPLRLHSAL